jgi:hypothetical protein
MTDLQAIADRVEIEALRGEFTDAAMMRDRARLAALFTPGGTMSATPAADCCDACDNRLIVRPAENGATVRAVRRSG